MKIFRKCLLDNINVPYNSIKRADDQVPNNVEAEEGSILKLELYNILRFVL